MKSDPSTSSTLLVAAGVALVCSLFVSTAVYLLRPVQQAYAALESNRVILMAAGLVDSAADLSDREVVNRFLELDARVVDLETGWFARGIEPYEIEALRGPKAAVPIPEAQDIAGLGERPRYVPVYLLIRDDRIQRIVLPVYGQGMWSTIYGYLSLESDFNTIAGVEFHRHGETPGIGDRILEPAWRSKWRGKRIYDPAGQLRFRIGNEDLHDTYRIDSISGASVTAGGVEGLVRYWLGGHGFGPLLTRLREQAAPGAAVQEET